jgi:hypothetical protein
MVFEAWGNSQEPSISSTDSNIENQVEILIERCIAGCAGAVCPRVIQQCRIFGLGGEVTELVERLLLLVTQKENLLDSAVNVEVDVILSPLHAVGVERVGIFATADLLCAGRAPVRISQKSWPPSRKRVSEVDCRNHAACIRRQETIFCMA